MGHADPGVLHNVHGGDGLASSALLMRKMHEVEPLTSHYVGLLVVARIIRMMFWVKLFVLGEHFVQLLIADMVHALFSADYLWLWLKKLKSGGFGLLWATLCVMGNMRSTLTPTLCGAQVESWTRSSVSCEASLSSFKSFLSSIYGLE